MTDVRLRAVEHDDLDIFHRYESEPEGRRRAGFPERDRETFMRHWETRVLGVPGNESRTVLADGEVAGNVLSWPQEGRRMVGYWYGERFWGKGIASRALELFLAELAERPLYADTVVGNTGSRRVLEKCGFREVPGEEEGVALYVHE